MEASFLFFYLITLLFQDNYRHTCSLVSPNGEKLLQYHNQDIDTAKVQNISITTRTPHVAVL